MSADGLIFAFYGLILIVAGIGLMFVRLGRASYKKDNERHGPLSSMNIGMAYTAIKTNKTKNIISLILTSVGVAVMLYALQQ
ncbi:MAG: hypothetical protein WBQ78_07275 [Gammaproteobacteria bacterium]